MATRSGGSFILRQGRMLLSAAVLSIPVVVWIKDKGFGLYYVSGDSMAPTLQDGDVVLVRKIHVPLRMTTAAEAADAAGNDGSNNNHNNTSNHDADDVTRSGVNRNNNNNQHSNHNLHPKDVYMGTHSFPPNADDHWERDLDDAYCRRREDMMRQPRFHPTRYYHHHHPFPHFHQQQQHLPPSQSTNNNPWLGWLWGNSSSASASSSSSRWLQPPQIYPGQVIVFWSPTHYQELCIKRVIGVGGQFVLPRDFQTRFHLAHLTRRDVAPYLVPPMYWYVEGDHPHDNSTDSRHYGPIPQRLLVGVVDCIVWPPSRRRQSQSQPQSMMISRSLTASTTNNGGVMDDSYPMTRAWWQ